MITNKILKNIGGLFVKFTEIFHPQGSGIQMEQLESVYTIVYNNTIKYAPVNIHQSSKIKYL